MLEGDELGVDARAVYVQLLTIADDARYVRQAPETCSTDEVDGLLEAYAATRTLCNEITCKEKTPVSLPDLGRIAEDKQYTPDKLRAILTVIEVECFKGVGALAGIITLIPNEEVRHE
jgi:hypothetical protein